MEALKWDPASTLCWPIISVFSFDYLNYLFQAQGSSFITRDVLDIFCGRINQEFPFKIDLSFH